MITKNLVVLAIAILGMSSAGFVADTAAVTNENDLMVNSRRGSEMFAGTNRWQVAHPRGVNRLQQGMHREGSGVAGGLSAKERWALNEAIQDEYKARATYAKVIHRFGDIRPFSNIIHAESRHIDVLTQLYNRYGLSVPEDTWYDKVPAFDTLREACAAAVQAEVDNAALYDEIMAEVEHRDVASVFTALRNASIERHLPAFQRCLDRGAGQGRGGQNGRGHGRGRGQHWGRRQTRFGR